MEAEKRKKLYNINTSQEAPNMVLSYAQDSDFINSIANFATISPGNVSEKANAQIKRALLKGTHGFNPATGELIKLSSLGEAGQSRVVDTESLNDPYLNYTLEGVEGEAKDSGFYDKRYKTEQKTAHKDLTDYVNKRHLVHLEESDAWRGHMGSHPIFAEDVYTDDDGNIVFKNQADMQKRLSGDAVDLYDYGNRDVYMTNEEEEAYKKAMIQNNMKATYDNPLWSLPGMIASFGSAGITRGALQQGMKQLAKKEGVQAIKQVLKQPLLTNALKGTKYAQYSGKYMLNPLKIADVAGGVYGVNQFTDSNSTTRQSIRDYQQGKGSFGDAAFNTTMSALSATPVGSEILRTGYGNLVGGVDALRKMPQVRDFRTGFGQVTSGEASIGDLFRTQKYSRFTKPGQTGSSKDLVWFKNAKSNVDPYKVGADKVSDLKMTNARASVYNAKNIQNRINSGITNRAHPFESNIAERSIAPVKSKPMQDFIKNTPALQNPKTLKQFELSLKNPNNYWKLPGHTDEIATLLKNSPADQSELAFSKKIFKDIKAYDASKWSPEYNLLDDLRDSFGGAKSAALNRSKKLFDLIASKSSKLGKIGKVEQGGLDFTESSFEGYNDKGFKLKAE